MRLFGMAVLVVAVVVMFTCGTVLAADEAVTVTGKVAVVKSDAGVVTAVTVTAADGVVYAIAADNMKRVAERDGKTVEITGTVAEVEGKRVLTVKTIKVVEEK